MLCVDETASESVSLDEYCKQETIWTRKSNSL